MRHPRDVNRHLEIHVWSCGGRSKWQIMNVGVVSKETEGKALEARVGRSPGARQGECWHCTCAHGYLTHMAAVILAATSPNHFLNVPPASVGRSRAT